MAVVQWPASAKSCAVESCTRSAPESVEWLSQSQKWWWLVVVHLSEYATTFSEYASTLSEYATTLRHYGTTLSQYATSLSQFATTLLH